MSKILKRIVTFGRMIRFSHILSAMPFALTSIALASYSTRITLSRLPWIIIAMIGARSATVGINRIADRQYDATNPRTRDRELPANQISVRDTLAFVVGPSLLLVFAAHELNQLCSCLSPVALTFVFFYSFVLLASLRFVLPLANICPDSRLSKQCSFTGIELSSRLA
jgi:4-hydroxybenzoate polyprenyltransferase